MKPIKHTRRNFLLRTLAAGSSVVFAGCDRLSQTELVPRLLHSAETLNERVHHLVTSRRSMAQEFSAADLSPVFRSNGTANPNNAQYQALAADGFSEYRLKVLGLVETPKTFSLSELHALPSRTQITRHDCVEGWSAIGKWKGARFDALMQSVRPTPEARYAVFYCADPYENGTHYYESIDMEDAYHPQTILAYELNDQRLPVANGAPVRLRVERQLGYKMAKYVMAIELVDSFEHIGGGKGGYWEDQEGYEWYAGI
jgi:DMSO/TMAO reductase YedYZ molybdopterin-dependent catalytic subunit